VAKAANAAASPMLAVSTRSTGGNPQYVATVAGTAGFSTLAGASFAEAAAQTMSADSADAENAPAIGANA
jgi:hypothetical protein